MKLPTQNSPVERTTYKANAAGSSAHVSFALTPSMQSTLFPYMNF